MPPSSVVRLLPRSGELLEPLTVTPRMTGPPLSLKKAMSVFSDWPVEERVARRRPMAASMEESMAA